MEEVPGFGSREIGLETVGDLEGLRAVPTVIGLLSQTAEGRLKIAEVNVRVVRRAPR